MRAAGLDIGSRTTKLVVRDRGATTVRRFADTSHDPLSVARTLLDGVAYDRLVVTGYGRHLVGDRLGADAVSEIKAAAIGARAKHPRCRTIIDVGGQDTKVIALDPAGRMSRFHMNDRCAAGTGRFLELMAVALGLPPDEFAALALAAPRAEKLTTMCAVFAESEVVSLVARGAPRDEIARGIHEAVATRISAMARSLPLHDDLVFVGGGALNRALATLVARALDRPVAVPEEPRLAAALGCALLAEAPPREAAC
ncbi:MAG: 3-hydroxyacyl-ACP dehydratase [Deltaproteobacteria bacterium HGW-Deltaproteobacteria-14]|nr:MAG: 3-hydroxyacyl-ACP dehydratase [Deltaproteobacteria bacterium HGW-Deltaproteobacteria-14]